MKISQEKLDFKDITIIIESKKEASALRELVDLVEKKDLESGKISKGAYELSIKLSNAFTDGALEVPLTALEKNSIRKNVGYKN